MSEKKPLPKQGYPPDLSKYINKTVLLRLNGDRRVIGKIIGFDHFMNVSLDDAVEYVGGEDGWTRALFKTVVRGTNIIFWECRDKVD